MERWSRADMCDQRAGGGRGDARHVVVLGVPHPAVPTLPRALSQGHTRRAMLCATVAPPAIGARSSTDVRIVTEHCPSRKVAASILTPAPPVQHAGRLSHEVDPVPCPGVRLSDTGMPRPRARPHLTRRLRRGLT